MIVDELQVTASTAPALRRVRALLDWLGSGRPLTQTGRVRLADALALVERMDTGDVLDVLARAEDSVALTELGRLCVPAWLGVGTPGGRTLLVRVTLEESAEPAIWQRLRVSADIRLDRFHQVLGAAMGWQDSHLHVFEHGNDRFGHPDPDLDIVDDRTDPGDAEREDLLEWLGIEQAGEFDAAAFDIDRANEAMAGVLAACMP